MSPCFLSVRCQLVLCQKRRRGSETIDDVTGLYRPPSHPIGGASRINIELGGFNKLLIR